MKLFILLLVFAFSMNVASGQVTDNFSDGNFYVQPIWTGDTSDFIVNTQGQLQLHATTAGASLLSTEVDFSGHDTIEWELYLEQSFSPSSQNYSRYYLFMDSMSLSTMQNAYYLQFGESGTNDAIALYKQSGSTTTLLGRGLNGRIASAFGVSIKVYKYANGDFEIFTDFTGGENYQLEFFANDPYVMNLGYLCWQCTYTISNSSSFYLDNVYAGEIIQDTIKPVISIAKMLSDSVFQIEFSEAIHHFSLQNNLQVLQPVNSTVSILSTNDSILFVFSMLPKLQSGEMLNIRLLNVQDDNNNVTDTIHLHLLFVSCEPPVEGDLVINELMCNPSGANNLPNVEYVEVFNTSDKYISTQDCFIADPSNSGALPFDTLPPLTYKIYTTSNGKLLLGNFGVEATAISDFPTLNNDGDRITLLHQSTIIDEVQYDISYYNDDFKNAGGWSLEKIQSDFLCTNKDNWKASCQLNGGTPGEENCQQGIFIDQLPPSVNSVCITDSNLVSLRFTEEINVSGLTKQDFILDNQILPDTFFSEKSMTNHLTLDFNFNFLTNEVHHLKIKNVSDCGGNLLDASSQEMDMGVGESPNKSELIFNEIMFNPLINCTDFIELYNPSNKIISLKNLSCCRRNLSTNQLEYNPKITSDEVTILPHDYVLLTNDVNFLSCYPQANRTKTICYAIPSMNDDEGILVLLNENGNVLDELHYHDYQHSPLLTNQEGISLERVNASAPTSEENNWKSASYSSGYSTPTRRNSQDVSSEDDASIVSIHPDVFSPDNDGFDDYALIEISEKNAGSWGSLAIVDIQGNHVAELLNTDLLGSNDKIIWDGSNDKKQPILPGIYILTAEIIDEKGTVKNIRKPIVIAVK